MNEELKYAVANMEHAKLRTLLTVLGIVIGVAIIVAILALGTGMRYSINQHLEALGSDKIVVSPAQAMSGMPTELAPFTSADIRELSRLPGVKDVLPMFYRPAVGEYRGESADIYVMGVEPRGINYFTEFYSIREGRMFRSAETRSAVIGYWIARKVFSREVGAGDVIKLNGRSFRVVGVLNEIGSPEDDTTVYIPLSSAQKLYGTGDEVTMIWVVVENPERVEVVAKRVEEVLERRRGGKDFQVFTPREIAEQVDKVLDIVSFVLGGIAGISMVVGGVIIMNTLLTSVMERTREIGVMKAVGASSMQVLRIFLIEAALIGLTGGVLGVILGSVLAKLIELAGRAYMGSGFVVLITPELVLFSLAFALLVGVLSGLYPAYRASRLEPVEALRYE